MDVRDCEGGQETGFAVRCYLVDDGVKSKTIRVVTEQRCREVCLMSNLPIMAGLYGIQHKEGVYYEVKIKTMNGIIAIGEFAFRLVEFMS